MTAGWLNARQFALFSIDLDAVSAKVGICMNNVLSQGMLVLVSSWHAKRTRISSSYASPQSRKVTRPTPSDHSA